MTIRSYIMALILAATGGMIVVAATAAVVLWRLDRLERSSGRASGSFRLVQQISQDAREWLVIIDTLVYEPVGGLLLAERVTHSCAENLERLVTTSQAADRDLAERARSTFRELLRQAKACQQLQDLDERDLLLEVYDQTAAEFIMTVEQLKSRANQRAQQELAALRSSKTVSLGAITLVVLVHACVLVFVHHWASRKIVLPIEKLAEAATSSMREDKPFILEKSGPRDIRVLNGVIDAFVGSLEERVRQRTADLAEANASLTQEIDQRKKAEQEREALHRDLLELSRKVGMSELATNVLHNVGNVLNSVNVSSNLALDKVNQSSIRRLRELAETLRTHGDEIGTYLTRDCKGRLIPSYMIQLFEKLHCEREDLLSQLKSVSEGVEHIKSIIHTQQSFATGEQLRDWISLTDAVEDAVRLNAAALIRHQVELERDYRDVPSVFSDRHKVVQIITNFLSNAKYAVSQIPGQRRRVVIRIGLREDGEGRAYVEVCDNGVGVPPENRTKLFQHGFTTKKDGHGFGLHSCGVAATEIGSRVSCHSDGPGTGATFTLELPLEHDRARA